MGRHSRITMPIFERPEDLDAWEQAEVASLPSRLNDALSPVQLLLAVAARIERVRDAHPHLRSKP